MVEEANQITAEVKPGGQTNLKSQGEMMQSLMLFERPPAVA